MPETKKRGLSATALKLIALACMTLDHIYLFLSPAFPIPFFFRIIGRVAAPTFLFLVAESAEKTKNVPRLLLRLYLAGAAMSLINFYATDGGVKNSMFQTLFYAALLITLIRCATRQDARRRFIWIAIIFAAILLPIVAVLLFSGSAVEPILNAFLPAVTSVEGGLLLVLLGVAFWLARGKPAKCAVFGVFCVLYFVWTLSASGWSFDGLFTQNIQWLQLLALPFLTLYSGERGIGLKWLFYIYYPAHIYALWAIGVYAAAR